MLQTIQKILKTQNILYHKNQGITVCSLKDQEAGLSFAKDLLYGIVDERTVLYLSGGSTPKVLYERLVRDEKLNPGAVGLIDERYGPKFHPTSNELMIKNTGLLRYLQIRDIPFYPILEDKKSREETASQYDQVLRKLNAVFPKSLGILGIGIDGHTSGIAPNRKDFKNPLFDVSRKNLLVSEFDDKNGSFKERVTATFLALSLIDVLIILVFGQDKKEALELMFQDGLEIEIPARFYKRSEIAKKTLLITDQTI